MNAIRWSGVLLLVSLFLAPGATPALEGAPREGTLEALLHRLQARRERATHFEPVRTMRFEPVRGTRFESVRGTGEVSLPPRRTAITEVDSRPHAQRYRLVSDYTSETAVHGAVIVVTPRYTQTHGPYFYRGAYPPGRWPRESFHPGEFPAGNRPAGGYYPEGAGPGRFSPEGFRPEGSYPEGSTPGFMLPPVPYGFGRPRRFRY